MHKSHVIIIGAGLGGLALAHGLRGAGFNVTVYERDSHAGARPQGHRIQLNEPGLNGLRQCLPESLFNVALATAGTPPPRVTIRDPRLEVIADPAAANHHRPDAPRPRAFNRATLREILLCGLADTVRYGAELEDYHQDADGAVTVRFADGRVDHGDILVGADGVGSIVRRRLLPHAAVGDAGLRLIYGKIPLDANISTLLPEWVFESIFTVVTGGPGRPHVGMGPVQFGQRPDLAGSQCTPPLALTPTDDYLALMVGAPADHPAMPDASELRRLDQQGLRRVAENLIDGDWHPAIHRMLSLWSDGSLLPLRISTATPVPNWGPGAITLIGDAVHAMSPVLAMGANTALRDAGELTAALSGASTNQGALIDAIAGYQQLMTEYAFPLVANSRTTGQARVGQA